MKYISINKELCIGCGKCVNDCVSEKIKLIDGKAEFLYERCIECGHCYAICPTKAVTMEHFKGYEGEKVFDFTKINSEELLSAMKSRRTIRCFKDTPVSKEEIEKIILSKPREHSFSCGYGSSHGLDPQGIDFGLNDGLQLDDIHAQLVEELGDLDLLPEGQGDVGPGLLHGHIADSDLLHNHILLAYGIKKP